MIAAAIESVRAAIVAEHGSLGGHTASGALAAIGESLANVERQCALLEFERKRQERVAKERAEREAQAQAERERKLEAVRACLAKRKGKK